ncbi:TIGR00341 family protein [Myxosarcina sp. GI1]|uniref:TIGR00341 family protein n=1 Tax=Myxosarcina sp. GI1 TaxID=1541065 RepID=UPI000566C28E|nr:TIGR00341 family protein [Myxosarcina sp. GI1]
MALRLIEVFLPLTEEKNIRQLLSSDSHWTKESIFKSQEQLLVQILLEEEWLESVASKLKEKFAHLEDFQLLLLPVESLPIQNDSESAENSLYHKDKRNQEIYDRVAESIHLCSTEISLVILSTAIAAIGLVEGSEVVIIGAMVIAPLLKPNMALAVATTFGDLSLAIKTVKVGLTEIFLSLLLSICLGILVPVNLCMQEIAIRTSVNFSDVVLAFASGAAGAISLTVGEQSAVVGVMVSVALLPPLVALGMLIGSQLWQPAVETAVLVLTNIACLNLAAIATFWLRDIRPQKWWQKFQAGKITGIVTTFWTIILILLIVAIFMFQFDVVKGNFQ